MKLSALLPVAAASIRTADAGKTIPIVKNDKSNIRKGKVRELVAYDLLSDMYMVRHDVATRTKQWTCSHSIYTKDDLAEYRKLALRSLRDSLNRDGVELRSLIDLPGAEWITEGKVEFLGFSNV